MILTALFWVPLNPFLLKDLHVILLRADTSKIKWTRVRELSFLDYWLDQILIITPGSANFEGKKQIKTQHKTKTKQKKNKKNISAVFLTK